jgi:hypothetical protein
MNFDLPLLLSETPERKRKRGPAQFRYIRDLWLGCLASTVACIAALQIWAEPWQEWHRPAPALINPMRSYIASYSKGHADHFLYEFGIYGFRRRMLDADVLLMGSSHMEYGIDARRLAEKLSRSLGRPMNVINLGRGFGDGYAFTRRIVEANDIRNQIVIVELFEQLDGGYSNFANFVHSFARPAAYSLVLSSWADYAADWLKDHIVPRLILGPGSVRVVRQLTAYSARSLDTADVEQYWAPDVGDLYLEQRTPPAPPIAEPNPLPDDAATRMLPDPEYCRQRHLTCFYTLLPYYNFSGKYVTMDNIDRFVKKLHLDYLPIAPEGLTYFDTMHHLDAAGRRKATERLATRLIPLLQHGDR